MNIPRPLVDANTSVTLEADVMFVNSVPFLMPVSRNINLITIEHAPSPCTATSLGFLLQRIVRVYARAGFTVQTILMDIEFEKVRDHVPMLDVNTPAASEHRGHQTTCLSHQGKSKGHHLHSLLPPPTLNHVDSSTSLHH